MAKALIAGSGMSNGGRIIHHEKRFLPDPHTTLLLVGYQSPGTLGRRLQDGAKRVHIAGEEVAVRASVMTLGGYSAHNDSQRLMDFRDYLGINASAPRQGDIVEIEV